MADKVTSSRDQQYRDFVHRMEDDSFLAGCLIALYRCQEVDEQAMQGTVHPNGIGFNMMDAHFLTSVAKQFLKLGRISERQILSVRRNLKKYARQLMALNPSPMPVENRANDRREGCEAPQLPQKSVFQRLQEPEPVSRQAAYTVKLNGKTMEIRFPFDREAITKIKTLTGRRWDAKKKCWTAPLCFESVEKLKDWDFSPDDALRKYWKSMQGRIQPCPDIPGLKGALYPFQKEGVAFIESRNGSALIADEMGLGKTIEALAWLQLHPEARPAVIVCPASVKLNWAKEAANWLAVPNVRVLSGRPKNIEHAKRIFVQARSINHDAKLDSITILNWDILANTRQTVEGKRNKEEIPGTGWADILPSLNIKTIVLDEIHLCRNPKALRTKAVKRLCKDIPNVIGLSGTPIVNRPIEMFTGISLIMPSLFPSFFNYAQRFCDAKQNQWGWDFNGSSNEVQLHDLLARTCMLRRLTKDVLPDLPEITRSVVPMELKNRAEYDLAEANFVAWLRGRDLSDVQIARTMRAEALAKIEALKQLCIKAKMEAVVQWVTNWLDVDGKLVVFCTHKSTVSKLMEVFKSVAVKLDGSTSAKDRQRAVDKFQKEDNIRLFVGNLKAASMGITLTAASNTAFLELGWTSGDHDQAEARVRRIGTTASHIGAHYLIAPNTIEEKICELLDKKRNVLAGVLNGEEGTSESLLTDLLDGYK